MRVPEINLTNIDLDQCNLLGILLGFMYIHVSAGGARMDLIDDTSIDFDAYSAEKLDRCKGGLSGLTHHEFLTYCTGIAATMGSSSVMGIKLAEATTAPQRPPVIWLHGQDAVPNPCSAPISRL